MPPNVPRDRDHGPRHASGHQHCGDGPSSTGLLPWAARLFPILQKASPSNVTFLNGARHVQVHGHAQLLNAQNLNVVNNHNHSGSSDDLNIMKPSVSFGSLHDSYADDPEHRCPPGTREYVLQRLQDWIDNVTSTERIFWLHGSAGSGKSAIAHTIADTNGQDKVVATFFFCRSDTDRNNGNRLFMTLAWQLALSNPSFKSHIIQSLNGNPGLPWRSVETQFKELILRPFEAIVHNAVQLPLVVIVDGIDECIDKGLQRRILEIIGKVASNEQVPLRFLICSRLEPHIQRVFDQIKCPILTIDLRLEKLEELVTFEAIYNSRDQNLARRWKSSSHKRKLKQLQGWVDNPGSVERISWLHGPAGSGKSAVAQTIAGSNEPEKVVATFFFDKSDATHNDGTRLFPTLCWQIASSIPVYKDYIVQYLAQCSYLPTQDIQGQFEKLIIEPFEAQQVVGSQMRLLDYVVIVDGIDGCVDQVQWKFLKIIGNVVTTRCIPLRFLISSRHKHHIQHMIDRFQWPILTIDLSNIPRDTGTRAKPRNNIKIRDYQYRYQFPHSGLFPDAAILPVLPPSYDCGMLSFAPYPRNSSPESEAMCLTSWSKSEDDTRIGIERYFKAEFARIATEQKLWRTWPGQQVIQDFANKSGGQFIYANTLIRLIREEGSNAKTVLNLIRDLQPRTRKPFAYLDELYLQILKWQPDQAFLKGFLAVMVVRSSILEDHEHLWKDDLVLMNVSEEELQTKLQRMHPLLQIECYIDVHDQSFLHFLQDASRSGPYHISNKAGLRRYLRLIISSLVRYVKKVAQPNYGHHHLAPNFSQVIKKYPRRIELPVADWQDLLQPLLKLGLKIFNSCTLCTTVRVIRDLCLHLAFVRGISSIRSTNTTTEEFDKHLGATSDNVYAILPNSRSHSSSINTDIITEICALLYFDCAIIAERLDSFSDAQDLVDLLVDMLDKRLFLDHGPDVERKAILLVLQIYTRIPVLPRSLFLGGSARSSVEKWNSPSSEIEILCQSALIGKILHSKYIVPVSWICEEEGEFTFVGTNGYERSMSLSQWRRTSPCIETVIQVMLGVAKAFQYLHSMGIVLHYSTNLGDIFLDSSLSVKIRFFGTFLLYIVKMPSICLEERSKILMTREANVFNFGCLLYEMVFNVEIPPEDKARSNRPFNIIVKPRTKPKIPNEVWNIIELCCRTDSKRRPTMNEVAVKMEKWSSTHPLPGSWTRKQGYRNKRRRFWS